MGSESAAKTATNNWKQPAPSGYTLTTSATEGTVYNLQGVEWKLQSAGPVAGSGTTTTRVEVKDADGNVISDTTTTTTN